MQRAVPIDPARATPRRFLRALAATVVVALVAASGPAHAEKSLPLTPSQTEGPFYPTSIPADHDADLTQVAGRAAPAQGALLYFTGRVLTPDGKPHAGATVELWQCDAYGRYHHAGDAGSPRDDGFQGYGVAVTDAEGRYAFKTIRPVPYTGRVPHMHLKVRTPGGAALTTQVYIKGDRTAGDPVLAWSPRGTLDLLTMTLAPAPGREPGAQEGSFNIVVR